MKDRQVDFFAFKLKLRAAARSLLHCRYDVPLVADIHFQPVVAMMVAEAFEKIRINPGNFADGRKTFKEINYDDPREFELEREHIEEVFTPLVLKCKELGRAMRIGTNHGSLSARILSYYGDTPRGEWRRLRRHGERFRLPLLTFVGAAFFQVSLLCVCLSFPT